jgi:cell shape-determining protein MreD
MRYWTGAVIACFLAIVQASSVEQFKILGVSPNLMMVFLVAWLVIRGLEDVLPMVFVAGVTFGLVGLQSPGVVLLALLPIAAFGAFREMHVIHSDLVLVLVLVFGASLAYEVVTLASVMATGGGFDVFVALQATAIPAAIVNVAIAGPVYFVMRLGKPTERRGRLSY